MKTIEHRVTQRLGNARRDFTRPEEIPRQEQLHQYSHTQPVHSHCAANSASKRLLPFNFFTSTHSVNTLQSGTHQPPVRSRFRTPRPRNQRPLSTSHFQASADCTDGATMAAPLPKRIIKETERLQSEPVPGISALPHEDNARYFDVMVQGPDGSCYEGVHIVSSLATCHH
jgi:hypothetical protein